MCVFEGQFLSQSTGTHWSCSVHHVHKKKNEVIGLIKPLEEKCIHWQMMQTQSGISKQVNILLSYSTHKFYDPYEFHVYHSLHFNLFLSCGCRIVTLVAQRLAAIRNGMAFMPTFGRTSGCIYSWRCTVKAIGPDTKEYTVSKGSEVRTESSVAQRSDGGAASGCCSASAGGCV